MVIVVRPPRIRTVALVALLAVAGCNGLPGYVMAPTAPTGPNYGDPAAYGDLRVQLMVGAGRIARNEPVRLEIRIDNVGDEDVELRFVSSKQYDFWVSHAVGRNIEEVWRLSDGAAYEQIVVYQTVPAGMTHYYFSVFDPARIRAGVYYVGAEVTADEPMHVPGITVSVI